MRWKRNWTAPPRRRRKKNGLTAKYRFSRLLGNGAAASARIYTLVETVKANGLDVMKYIKYILSDMPGSTFLENPEYLDDYLPWDSMVQERCR
ncbi:MAG: transposase domain-containing protein [Eubacterium sp.]|nr:transposase domain-containing protein [Eubacterium sp.]